MKNQRSKTYFDRLINNSEEITKKAVSRIKEDSIPSDRIYATKYRILKRAIRSLIARYSRNDSYQTLKKEFISLLSGIEEAWTPKAVKLKNNKGEHYDLYIVDQYIYMRWMLSLCILLDLSNTYVLKLAELIKRDNVNDRLYDFLISSRFEDWELSEELALQEPKNRIVEIIDIQDKERCEKELKTYLEKEWYKTYKNFEFYNTHKKSDDLLLFYGYWAFEVAAVVKIKGLDDSSFRENEFYPDRLISNEE